MERKSTILVECERLVVGDSLSLKPRNRSSPNKQRILLTSRFTASRSHDDSFSSNIYIYIFQSEQQQGNRSSSEMATKSSKTAAKVAAASTTASHTSTTDTRLKSPPPTPLPTPAVTSSSLRHSYEIGRGETGVLSFEPYKSLILPYWAFRTVPVARNSSQLLWEVFQSYVAREDFVGADMARKFIQMGMTRARRYANHKGGRKYDRGTGEKLAKWQGGDEVEVAKRREKEEASEIFKAVWRRCIEDEEYQALKRAWSEEKKATRHSKSGREEGEAVTGDKDDEK